MVEFFKYLNDVDLKEILRSFKNGINQVSINSTNTKEYYIEETEKIMRMYCDEIGVSFDDHPIIRITPEDGGYWSYFGLMLMFYRVEKINLLLDYHYRKFKGKKLFFINSMENYVIDAVYSNGFFDNKKRIDKIVKWIEHKRKIFRKETVKPKWIPKYDAFLKALSELLSEKDYTNRKDDFRNVFLNGKIITWQQSPESLIYLIHILVTPPTKYITTTKGDKPFIQAIQAHFKFYDDTKKIVFRNDLKNVLYNVTKRSFKKHTELRSSIDDIISEVKKNL